MTSESLPATLEQLSSEVGVPLEDLLHTVESALAAAYARAFEMEGEVQVHLVPETGEIEVTQAGRQLPVEDFKRMAAQTARSAVMRHLRDLGRERAMSDVNRRHGELASGVIDRVERGAAYIDLGRVEGWMPPDEQIPGEELRPGRPVTVVLLEPKARFRQAQVRVSRASKSFVLRLLEAEVPEIKSGTVEVKAIAREAGVRTKLAVMSHDPSVDARGACIGPRGVRHRSLTAELGAEHVDIVEWSDSPERLVAGSLGPATVVAVAVDAESRTATVLVPRDQLSLAIGRDGQNARLAAKLTGWRIDIKPAEPAPEG